METGQLLQSCTQELAGISAKNTSMRLHNVTNLPPQERMEQSPRTCSCKVQTRRTSHKQAGMQTTARPKLLFPAATRPWQTSTSPKIASEWQDRRNRNFQVPTRSQEKQSHIVASRMRETTGTRGEQQEGTRISRETGACSGASSGARRPVWRAGPEGEPDSPYLPLL
ncbi:hypothetical protein GUJ93_ZPchr0008g13108 [Zizania palustris]|uniref:Uncharacterized protein n=1 Tax=Zizania palustris TaxID=103762 RepID=A0A8J5RGG8_ZIZPA|nr:hypothetical protein GUJ93_ZPchr0008g13108 [Zizania palustris]